MVPYIGDFAEDATIYHYFNTFSSNDPSASVTVTTLIDSDIYVYKDGSVTDIVTDGATIVIDFDARTGVHKLTIDTSVHADYSTGSDYMVLIEGATVDAGNITAAICTFSIQNRYSAGALRPTTAGRTLDVSATGEAGIDWANIGSPTTAQNLSATNIDVDQVVASVSGAVASVTAGVTLAAGAITDASLAGNMEIVFETDFATNYNQTDNAWVTNGTTFIGTGWNVGKTGYTLTAGTGLGNQTANITGTIDTVTTLTNLPAITSNWLTAAGLATDAVDEIADGVWDEALAGHIGADSAGLVLNDWQDAGRLDAILDTIAADVVNVDGYNLATQIGTAGDGLTNIGTIATVTTLTNLPAITANWLTAAGTAADFTTEIQTGLATAANLATVDTNVDNLNLGIIYGLTSGTPSTTSTDTDLSGYVTGELVGRVIVFTGGTANGQAATILTYTSTNGVVTFAALTTAPAASDTFKIV